MAPSLLDVSDASSSSSNACHEDPLVDLDAPATGSQMPVASDESGDPAVGDGADEADEADAEGNVEEEEDDSPVALRPPVTRSSLWESVLARSLKSGDADRLEAAINLAHSGGASREALRGARQKLRDLATAALASARIASADDPQGLSAAIDRADELHADADELRGAREELQRLASSRLRDTVAAGGGAPELEAALRLASSAGVRDAALLASAQQRLKELRPPPPERDCVLAVPESPPSDGCENASPTAFLVVDAKLEKPVKEAPSLPPLVIGRQSSDDFLLEAGLNKASLNRAATAPVPGRGGGRLRSSRSFQTKVAPPPPAPERDECSVQ